MFMQPLTVTLTEDSKKSILVVDDYSPTRNLLLEALGQSGDFHLAEATDGAEALELIKARPYDMVISDVMMPLMNGMDLLQAIRELNASTAVIMITAHPALELIVTAMKQGAVDFLKKPFDIDDLLFKVNRYLHDAGAAKLEIKSAERYVNYQKDHLSLQSYIYDAVENTNDDQEEIFQKIAELAMKIVDGESCVLALYDNESREFHQKVVINNDSSGRQNDAPYVDKIFRQVVEAKDAFMVHSDSNAQIAPSLICVPLMIRSHVLGVFSVRKKKYAGVFNNNDLHHIVSLSKRASLNLENKVLYESLYANLLDTFKSLVAAIQVRDHYTEEHCRRVSALAVKTAREAGCSPQEVEALRIAGLLHDIGKISIPDNILLKNGALSREEFEVIKTHPQIGDEILSSVVLLDNARNIIRHHHERWDGKGYPAGIGGEEIPRSASILAVCDSFDAMTTDRPYRKGMSVEAAAAELRNNCHFQFNAEIVAVFLNIL